MKEIKLGTIGSGAIVRSILDQVAVTEGIRLEAVYSRSEETGRSLAQQYGAEKVYTSLEQFFADGEINTVYIATPNLLHAGQTRQALLAGKHVICEKPFCVRADQARELADLARERGLFLVEAVPTTFLPNYEALRRALPEIGRVRLVQGNYSQYSSRYDNLLRGELPNIFNPQFGGGCLMDINFYNVYLNVALFGAPRRATYYPNLYRGLIDTSGMVVMEYEDFVSQCAGAKDTWGVNFFQIEGEKGYIYVSGAGGSNGLAQIRVVTGEGERTIDLQENPNRWYYEIRELTRLMLAGDRSALEERLSVTLSVAEVLEGLRKGAGLFFPGD